MNETEILDNYIRSHIDPEGDYLYRLYRATNIHTIHGRMASGHIQGRFLKLIVEMAQPKNVLEVGTFSGYSAICLAGTLVGAVIAYALGFWAWNAIDHWFIPGVFSQEAFDSVAGIYEEWNFWAVFTAGFTPIPYKIFTLAAGVFHINFGMFMLASVIGRGLRFFLVGWLIWKFGTPIKSFIDKYFNLIVIAFTVLLVGGFLLIKYAF